MQTFETNILGVGYLVVLVESPSDLGTVECRTGIGRAVLEECYGGTSPRALGSCYYNRKVILVCKVGSKSQILDVLRHEIGHAIAKELGLDPTDEALAKRLAGTMNASVRATSLLYRILESTNPNASWRTGSPMKAASITPETLDSTDPNAKVHAGADHGGLVNPSSHGREIFDLLGKATKIEIVANKGISIEKGPRVVQVRVFAGADYVAIDTIVRSMTEWLELRDSLKEVATTQRIPFQVLFN